MSNYDKPQNTNSADLRLKVPEWMQHSNLYTQAVYHYYISVLQIILIQCLECFSLQEAGLL
jgi:hypothetical protein